MKYKIHHKTVYRYAEPVRRGVHELRLEPRTGPLQSVHAWQVSAPGNLSSARDGFGNIIHNFTVSGPASRIEIVATGEVEVTAVAGMPGFYDLPDAGEARVSPLYFVAPTPMTAAPAEMQAFAAPFLAAGHDLPALLALADGIAGRVRYRAN
ncbi:transglutaminase N-terminal domain-containing protein, partial [Cupriavidus plantarum]